MQLLNISDKVYAHLGGQAVLLDSKLNLVLICIPLAMVSKCADDLFYALFM